MGAQPIENTEYLIRHTKWSRYGIWSLCRCLNRYGVRNRQRVPSTVRLLHLAIECAQSQRLHCDRGDLHLGRSVTTPSGSSDRDTYYKKHGNASP